MAFERACGSGVLHTAGAALLTVHATPHNRANLAAHSACSSFGEHVRTFIAGARWEGCEDGGCQEEPQPEVEPTV